MAHVITRIEGFEVGPTTGGSAFDSVCFDGQAGSAYSVQTAIKRTGAYALRMNPSAAAGANTALISMSFDSTGAPSTTVNFAAASATFYIYPASYPLALSVVACMRNQAATRRSVLQMSTAGILTLDGTAGSTPVTLNAWNRIEVLYDSASTGSVSLRLNGVQEFTGVTPTANGTVGVLALGHDTSGTTTYDLYYDDLVIEGAAAVASIDYPGARQIVAVDPDGDGFYDGVMITSPVTSSVYTVVQVPHDGNSSVVQYQLTGESQTFTYENVPTIVGVVNVIQATGTITRAPAAGISACRLLLRSGGVDVLSAADFSPAASPSYEYLSYLSTVSPFTAVAWTAAELNSLEFGFRGLSNNDGRASCFLIQLEYVDAAVESPGSGQSLPLPAGGGDAGDAAARCLLLGRSIGNYRVRVIYDPAGKAIDLTECLVGASALTQEKDIVLRSYRASDCELEFADLRSRFVDEHSVGFLVDHNGVPQSFGVTVDVEIYFDGAIVHTYRGFVIGVQARAAKGILRLGNRLQSFVQQQMLANDTGKIVSTTGATGTEDSPPLTGRYIAGLTVNTSAKARIETWTFTFLNATQFEVKGSITGSEGSGDTFTLGALVHSATATGGTATYIQLDAGASAFDNFYNGMAVRITSGSGAGQIRLITAYSGSNKRADVTDVFDIFPDGTSVFQIMETGSFTSDSGSITVEPEDWVGQGRFITGERTSIKTVWRSAETIETTIELFREILLSPQGANMDASDIDPSVDDKLGGLLDQPITNRYVVDAESSVIDIVQNVALHSLSVVIEKASAKIGLYGYEPMLDPGDTLPILCKTDDLMDASLDRTPVYNTVVMAFSYDEIAEEFTSSAVSPIRPPAGRIIEAPTRFNLRGFSEASRAWVESMGDQYRVRFEVPRQTAATRLKAVRLDAELDELYAIQSAAPNANLIMEPHSIRKNLLPEPSVDMELFDVGFYVQPQGACGYCFTDAGHLTDSCWVTF